MKGNDAGEILIRFDAFFEPVMLDKAELEKKRQDLVKAGAIEEINGQELVSPRKCAKLVFHELDQRRSMATASRSHDDILAYGYASLDYLRVWFYFLASMGPPKCTSGEPLSINVRRNSLKSALDDYHNTYEHLLSALELSLEADISANAKEYTMDDTDLATFLIPLDSLKEIAPLSWPQIEKRQQDMGRKDVIVEVKGTEHVMLSRLALFVLDDLDYLRLRAKTLRSEKAIEDYTFFSENYLEIWARIMVGRSQLATASGDEVTETFIREAHENALDCFQAIYRHTRDALSISLENGPLASRKE